MGTNSRDIDYWRNYFRSSNSDIFDVIENAILVASSDFPEEFRKRRGEIAELLFTCRLTRCRGCDNVESKVGEEDEEDEGLKSNLTGNGSKGNSSSDDHDDDGEMKLNTQVSNYDDEAEFLTGVIEEETEIVGEVLRIKEVLLNFQDESDGMLFESLRRLQLMELSVETLQATEIGKAVNRIRKHGSKNIRHLVRTLIDGWKILVDEWVSTTAAIKESDGSPDSMKQSGVEEEEEGLPSPPLDEGAFLTAPPTEMELAQFFDGMDDDGNPRNIGEFSKNNNNHESGRKHVPGNHNVPTRKPHPQSRPQQRENVIKNENKSPPTRKQETVVEKTKITNTNSGLTRFSNHSSVQKVNSGMKLDNVADQRRHVSGPQDRSDETSVRLKLEAAKRKLQEGYLQAENAKKQRTIQVMELHDLPKQGNTHRNPHFRNGAHNRNWSNGRR